MGVRVERCGNGTRLRVEAGTDGKACGLVGRLLPDTFIAGPAKVQRCRRWVRETIDLLPAAPANITQPEIVRSWPKGETKWITQAGSDDATCVGIRTPCERVIGACRASCRVETQDRAAEAHSIASGSQILTPQRSALIRRVAARIDHVAGVRVAELTIVCVCEVRAFAGADV